MGTSHSSAEFGRKLNTLALKFEQTPAEAMITAAREAVAAGYKVQPVRFLRNVGPAGSPLTIEAKTFADHFTVYAKGPWQIYDHPARAHIITSKYAKGSRSSRESFAAKGIIRRKTRSPGFVGPLLGEVRRPVILTPEGYRYSAHVKERSGKFSWQLIVAPAAKEAAMLAMTAAVQRLPLEVFG